MNATLVCGTNFFSVGFNLYPHVVLELENLDEFLKKLPNKE